MSIINVAEIKPDMVLANDLRGHNGRFLLARGTQLASKHIRVLKIWGVIEADIKGVSQEDIERKSISHIDPIFIDAAEKEIQKHFIHTDREHPAIHELQRLCTARKAEELHKKRSDGNVEFFESKEIKEVADIIGEDSITPVNPVELLKKDINLSTLPTIFAQINETIHKPHSSAKDIANVISIDTNLSTRLLRIVNSAFYGFPSKVDTLSRAVAIVGTKQLSTLALGINILTAFKNIPDDLINMKSFWEHSIACGTISRILASYEGIQNSERLFVAGLIHDIGRLVLYNYAPTNAKNALMKARYSNRLLYEIENENMGFDHSALGAMLLGKWKLPISLENIVKYHHSPKDSKDPLEPAIVHLANVITNALGVGSSGERFVPPLEPEAWECIGLSPNALSVTIDQMDRQLQEILRLFPEFCTDLSIYDKRENF